MTSGRQQLREPIYPLRERVIPRLLHAAAERWAERVAIREPGRSLTYAQVLHEAQRRGGAIQELGIGWQQPLLIMMDNHLDTVLTWLGATYQGRIEVCINTAYRGSLLAHVLNDSGAATIVIEQRYCERLSEIADDIAGITTVIVRNGDGDGLDPARFTILRFENVLLDGSAVCEEEVEPWTTYGIMYTSGTTGRSKGVIISHVHPYTYCSPEYFRLADEDDVILCSLPQFHIAGQWAGILSALYVGAQAVVLESFSVSTFWESVKQYGATQTTVVSTMADFLHRQPARADDADNPLRKVLMAPVIREIDEFQERFGLLVRPAFGQTELGSPVVGELGDAVPGGCGWVRPDFDYRLVDEHDLDVDVGKPGELILRPLEPWSIMLGYLNQPEATLAKWRNQWFHTGDTFQEAADGQLFFVDRSDDVIRRRGENISSYEVEVEVRAHPDVAETAVVGVTSEHYEQEIKAYIVLSPGSSTTATEIYRFLQPRMSQYMVPRYIEIVDHFDKTPTQRIQKSPLRQLGITDATWDAQTAGLLKSRRT